MSNIHIHPLMMPFCLGCKKNCYHLIFKGDGNKYFFIFLQPPTKVGAMWVDAGLNWNDFLTEDQDMNKFVTEQVSSISEQSPPRDKFAEISIILLY